METGLKRGVTIVMPCLNEELTLGICIDKANTYLKSANIDGEVVIADNGSTDRSIEIAKEKGARVVNVPVKGYGAALRGGIEAAEYEYIIMGDADDSYDFLDLQKYIDKLDEGYDVVMGNRFKGGIDKGAMSFSHRYIGNPILSGLGRLFFRMKDIHDFHCGQRGFRKTSIEKLNLCTDGMEFASEMVVKAALFGLKMTEIPCHLSPDGRNRPPHLRSIPDGLRHLEFLLIYSPKWLFAFPGMLLTVLGAIFTILIYLFPIRLGAVQFEVTTMLYSSLAMLVGFQMLQFSIFTSVFGRRIGQRSDNSKTTKAVTKLFTDWGYWISLVGVLVGFIGVVVTLAEWAEVGFGAIPTTSVCMTAILFGSLLALGLETFLFTVFLRILQMGGYDAQN